MEAEPMRVSSVVGAWWALPAGWLDGSNELTWATSAQRVRGHWGMSPGKGCSYCWHLLPGYVPAPLMPPPRPTGACCCHYIGLVVALAWLCAVHVPLQPW